MRFFFVFVFFRIWSRNVNQQPGRSSLTLSGQMRLMSDAFRLQLLHYICSMTMSKLTGRRKKKRMKGVKKYEKI